MYVYQIVEPRVPSAGDGRTSYSIRHTFFRGRCSQGLSDAMLISSLDQRQLGVPIEV